MMYNVGLIGARGHTGAELLKLIGNHPQLQLAFISSREHLGHRVEGFELEYVDHDPVALSQVPVDVVILAVPNGKTAPYIAAFEQRQPDAVIIDLSADRRFDPAWHYGLPELTRTSATDAKRISNPGCYATAMQLVLAPLNRLLDNAFPPQCFGVSGYSGAGTTPSDKNNPSLITGNLMPYSSIGHMHELEVSHRLGRAIEFMPTVAGHFRGITMTVNMHLNSPQSADSLRTLLHVEYGLEPLIRIVDDAPWVSRIAGTHGVEIGGITVSKDGQRAVIVATLDNLLKGAATQAMQNLNLALGMDEWLSIPKFQEAKG